MKSWLLKIRDCAVRHILKYWIRTRTNTFSKSGTWTFNKKWIFCQTSLYWLKIHFWQYRECWFQIYNNSFLKLRPKTHSNTVFLIPNFVLGNFVIWLIRECWFHIQQELLKAKILTHVRHFYLIFKNFYFFPKLCNLINWRVLNFDKFEGTDFNPGNSL